MILSVIKPLAQEREIDLTALGIEEAADEHSPADEQSAII
jgi:hypothetical protein